jgi:hypothetical protein
MLKLTLKDGNIWLHPHTEIPWQGNSHVSFYNTCRVPLYTSKKRKQKQDVKCGWENKKWVLLKRKKIRIHWLKHRVTGHCEHKQPLFYRRLSLVPEDYLLQLQQLCLLWNKSVIMYCKLYRICGWILLRTITLLRLVKAGVRTVFCNLRCKKSLN